jgi:hypothetical protein
MFSWILLVIVIVVFIYFYTSSDCTVLQTIKLDDIIVEIVDDACKEGLPHTTGPRTIRMTRDIWEGPRRDAVLRHERVHLQQKGENGAAWLDFYEKAWGYKCSVTPPTGIPAEYIARRRPNPDTDACPWAVWRDRYVFFSAFDESRTLRGAPVLVWDLMRGRQTAVPEEWRAEFCGAEGTCPHQFEHPHEISAEWITDGPSKIKTPAAYKLFAWTK